MEAELIISEVEKRGILWDSSVFEYKDKIKKKNAWMEVTSCIIENFALLSEDEKKRRAEDVTKKWKSLRDNYVRFKRKVSDESKSTQHGYERLRFLNKVIKLRKTASSMETPNSSDAVNLSTEENSQCDLTDLQCEASQSSTSLPEEKRRKRTSTSIEDKLSEFMDAYKPKEKNDDLLFLESLLPTIGKFSNTEKIEFRIKIMQLIQGIQTRNIIKEHSEGPQLSDKDDNLKSFNGISSDRNLKGKIRNLPNEEDVTIKLEPQEEVINFDDTISIDNDQLVIKTEKRFSPINEKIKSELAEFIDEKKEFTTVNLNDTTYKLPSSSLGSALSDIALSHLMPEKTSEILLENDISKCNP